MLIHGLYQLCLQTRLTNTVKSVAVLTTRCVVATCTSISAYVSWNLRFYALVIVMWPSGEEPSVGGARSSTGSEVVIIDNHITEPPAPSTSNTPVISKLNVSKSSKFHIGNKFVSVTNNVHSNEVVKGKLNLRFIYLGIVYTCNTRTYMYVQYLKVNCK